MDNRIAVQQDKGLSIALHRVQPLLSGKSTQHCLALHGERIVIASGQFGRALNSAHEANHPVADPHRMAVPGNPVAALGANTGRIIPLGTPPRAPRLATVASHRPPGTPLCVGQCPGQGVPARGEEVVISVHL